MQKLEINIFSAQADYLLAYTLQLSNWLKAQGASVEIRVTDEENGQYTKPPPARLESQNFPKDSEKMYSIVETDWLAATEILLNLNDSKSVKNRIALLKDGLVAPLLDNDTGMTAPDSHQPGSKTFSSSDFKGLTAFIRQRQEVIKRKKQIRKKIAALKKEFTTEQLAVKSAEICSQIEQIPQFQQAEVIFCYWSLPDEADTQSLIKKWYPQKRFMLPVVVGKDLVLKEFTGQENMKPEAAYGILEPTGDTFTNYKAIDLALIPGVAFDESHNRLGRGKGYYDRILNLLDSRTPLIGLAFDFQKNESIPVEEHDQKMSGVIYSRF